MCQNKNEFTILKGVEKNPNLYVLFRSGPDGLDPLFFSIFERLFFFELRVWMTASDYGKYAERSFFYQHPLKCVSFRYYEYPLIWKVSKVKN